MEIQDIKNEMKAFKDFYGGDLLDISQVDETKSKSGLSDIIDSHACFLESQLTDALSHLDRFKRKIGLSMMDLDK